MSRLALAALDRDGALREAAARVPPSTRGAFLARAGAALAGGLAAELAAVERAAGQEDDASILAYALTLEYLQAAFYSEAERGRTLSRAPARAAARIGAVERAHVAALRTALGSRAPARPAFDFQGATSGDDAFLTTAVALEELSTAAYKGQLGEIRSREYLAAAASIHTVEARQAAWVGYLAARPPAPNAADEPIARAGAERAVAATAFVAAPPVTTAARAPSFAG